MNKLIATLACTSATATAAPGMATTTMALSDMGTTITQSNPDQAVADAANALYRQSNTGVNMHIVDKTEDPSSPWLACLTASGGCSWQPLGRLSAVVLNHLAWNEAKKQITTFGTMNAVGWIGTEKVTKELTNCIFPGDGGSMKRSHAGCGCISTHTRNHARRMASIGVQRIPRHGMGFVRCIQTCLQRC